MLNTSNLGSHAVDITLGDNNATTSYAGKISGAGSITKKGSGVITLSSATSDFTGAFNISTGTVRISSSSALGATSGTTISAGAALELVGGITVSTPLTINGSGDLSGGALRNISDANTYSGPITLASNGRINANAGTLLLSGGITSSSSTLTIGGAADITISAAIGLGTGSLVKDGANTLSLTHANTYANTTLTGGILSLGAASSIPTSAGTITFGGGMLQFTSSNTYDYSGLFDSSTANQAFKFDTNGQTVTFASSITSTGGTLAKYGTGTLILSGANGYTGATTINTGTLRAQNNLALGTTAGGVTVSSGSTLELYGGITIGAEAITVSGSGVNGIGVIKNVSGNNTYQGAITLGSDSIFSSDSGTVTLSGAVGGSGKSITAIGLANIVISGNIATSAGSITKGLTSSDTGVLTLSGSSNSYTGGTTISYGTVSIGYATALNTGAVFVDSGAHLNVASTISAATIPKITGTGYLDLTNNAVVTLSYNDNYTFAGSITDHGSLVITEGSGKTLTLSGASSYYGTTTLTSGTLAISSDANLGNSSSIVFNGGTLQSTGSTVNLSSTHGMTLTQAATINVNSGTTLNYNGVITGAAALSKTGSGTLYLYGTSDYTGATTVSQGTLEIGSAAALGNVSSGTTVSSGASLYLVNGVTFNAEPLSLSGTGVSYGAMYSNGNNNYQGAITLAGNSTIYSISGTLTLSGGVTGSSNLSLGTSSGAAMTVSASLGMAGTLTKTDYGTLLLSSANTYSGATSIQQGVVQISDSSSLGDVSKTPKTTVFSGATLELWGSKTFNAVPLTINGSGYSSGALRNASGSNTYSGAITLGSLRYIYFDASTQTLTLLGNILGSGGLYLRGIANFELSGSIQFSSAPLYVYLSSASSTVTLLGATANTYTGGTTLYSGILVLNKANALSTSGNISLAASPGAATLRFTSNDTNDYSSRFSSNSGLTIDTNGLTITFGSALVGFANGITVAGGGTLNLNGANSSYSGNTIVNSGTTVTLENIAALGTFYLTNNGTVNVASGTTNISIPSLAGSGILNLSNLAGTPAAVTATIGSSGYDTSYSGAITGLGIVTKIGNGNLTLSGNNSYAGGTNVNAGYITLNSQSALGGYSGGSYSIARVGSIVFGGGTLVYSSSNTNDYSSVFTNSGTQTIKIDTGSQSVLFASVIGASSHTTENISLVKYGDGTLTLSGNNTYTGGTTVNRGVLQVSGNGIAGGYANGLGSGDVTICAYSCNNGTGSWDGVYARTSQVIYWLASGSTIINNFNLSGSAVLTSKGSSNTYSGNLALTQYGGYSPSYTATGSFTQIISGNITGSSAFTLNKSDGSGVPTFNLSGLNNTFSGGLSVSSGNLVANGSSSSVFGTGVLTVNSGGNVTASSTTTAINISGIAGGGTITLTNGNTQAITMTFTGSSINTYSGSISGLGFLVMNGSGRQILSGANSYQGTTTISSGVLQFGTVSSLYNGDTTNWIPSKISVASGATLAVNYGGVGDISAANISLLISQLGGSSGGLTSGSYLGFDVSTSSGAAATFSNVITDTYSGTHSLGINVIAGTLTLLPQSGGLDTSNSFTGNVRLSGGTLSLGNLGAIGSSGSSSLIFYGGTLQFTSANTYDYSSRFSTASGQSFNLDTNGQAVTLATSIQSSGGSLTKTGTGTLILSGANTYNGSTTISQGTLQLGASNVIADASSMYIYGTFDLNGNSDAVNGISQNGIITNSSTSSNSTLTIGAGNASSTFDGTITDASATYPLILVKSGSGTITLTGSNTYRGLTTINSGGALVITNAAALGSIVSGTVVNSGGSLVLAGAAAGTSFNAEPLTISGTGVGSGDYLGALVSALQSYYTTNSNTYTGLVTLAANATVYTAYHSWCCSGSASSPLTFDPSSGNSFTGAYALTLAGSSNITVNDPIATSSLVVSNSATTTLSANNTYSGSTTVSAGAGTVVLSGTNSSSSLILNGGTTRVSADAALGAVPGSAATGVIVFNGGTLNTTSNFTVNANRGITLTGVGTIDTNASTTLTYSGILAGTGGALNKNGSGTLILGGQ